MKSHGRKRQLTCKPGSVRPKAEARDVVTIHLGRALLRASCNQPGWLGGKHARLAPRHPYLVLLPVGFTLPVLLPVPRCALTAPFHPYSGEPERFAFCGTFPGVAPAGLYPAPCFRGARTFLSPRGAATRSTGEGCLSIGRVGRKFRPVLADG